MAKLLRQRSGTAQNEGKHATTFVILSQFESQKGLMLCKFQAVTGRQWPEVSDFVARFCTLHESENTWTCAAARIARVCAQRAKKCDTNHIPKTTA